MATGPKGLSVYDSSKVPDASGMKFGVVVADWNSEITYSLLDGAVNTLVKHGAHKNNIKIIHVPGSFELTLGAKIVGEKGGVDSVICIGCVIQGETRHFDFICQSITQGITRLNIDLGIPVIFGVLTTDDLMQAKDRAGGKLGNKGDEAAVTAIIMTALKKEFQDVN
jgi:6,7-dimethyl-8-ribityllumazine synthase